VALAQSTPSPVQLPLFVLERECTKCHKTKALSIEFYARDPRCRFGLTTWCRDCIKAYQRGWNAPKRRAKREEKQTARVARTHKVCPACKVNKPLDDFAVRNGRVGQVLSRCRECRRGIARRVREEYPERQVIYSARYRERHLEEARARGRTAYHRHKEQWRIRAQEYAQTYPDRKRAIYKRYRETHPAQWHEYNRRRRARKLGSSEHFTEAQWQQMLVFYNHQCLACGARDIVLVRDHVNALVDSHDDSIMNIQPLCVSCNAHKWRKSIDYRPAATLDNLKLLVNAVP